MVTFSIEFYLNPFVSIYTLLFLVFLHFFNFNILNPYGATLKCLHMLRYDIIVLSPTAYLEPSATPSTSNRHILSPWCVQYGREFLVSFRNLISGSVTFCFFG